MTEPLVSVILQFILPTFRNASYAETGRRGQGRGSRAGAETAVQISNDWMRRRNACACGAGRWWSVRLSGVEGVWF